MKKTNETKVNNVETTNTLLNALCNENENYEIKAYSHGAKVYSKAIKRSICEVHINENSNMIATNKITTSKMFEKAIPHFKKSDEKKENPYYYTINNVKSNEVVKMVKELEKAYTKKEEK